MKKAWPAIAAILAVVALYFVAPVISATLLTPFFTIKQLQDDIAPQFFYVLITEAICVGAIIWALKLRGTSIKKIGLRKPSIDDLLNGLLAVVPYFVLYFLTVGLVSQLIPGLNVDQKQDVGFSSPHGVAQLILTFIALVILPPIAEEIMVRGLLYSGLKKSMPKVVAAIVTSLIFASAHLPEGGSAGPLYIAALDTFILSLVLVYLREKTKGLYAGMVLHAVKNGVAFVLLYIVH